MDNNKLKKIAKEQIKKLKTMQIDSPFVSDSIKISNEIREWCKFIKEINASN